jgi:imidazolonepropionase-like amidohydrolase
LYIANRVMSEADKAAAEKGLLGFIDEPARLVQRATKAGVKIAAGSDEWMRYPGKTRGQATKSMLRALVRDGMSPAAVIRAATVDAAEVLGWSDRVGSLGAGHFADIIAVQGDPLTSRHSTP